MRYRHTDTDIVRSARQQDFLSQARQQVRSATCSSTSNDLIQIFTEYTTSDISNVRRCCSCSTSRRIPRRRNQAGPLPGRTRSQLRLRVTGAIHQAVEEFLGEAGHDPRGSRKAKKKRRRRGRSEARQGQEEPRSRSRSRKPPGSDELVPASKPGEPRAKIVARQVGGGFPVFYPTRLPSGAAFVETNPYEHVVDPRVYHLKDKDKERHPAYRMVGIYQPEYERHHYFGVQGIRAGQTRRSSTTRAKPRRSTAANTTSSSTAAGSDGRLAPRRKHLLGLERACSARSPTTR